MSRGRGGYIGFNRVPAAAAVNSAASGVWTLREAEALKRAGTWPTAFEGVNSITGLQLWLDASDSATLFDATTGGSLVAADGTVKRWEDKSGNGRHATEGTNGPTLKTAQINNRSVLRFDGTNDFLSGDSTPSSGNVRTIFCVAKLALAGSGHIFQIGKHASFSGSPAAFWVNISMAGAANYIAGDMYVNNITIASNVTVTNAFVATYVNSSNTALDFFHNGLNYPPSGSLRSFAPGASGYFVGKFRSDGDIAFANADIAEIIVYDSALSSTNRTLVENYLIAKWGIT